MEQSKALSFLEKTSLKSGNSNFSKLQIIVQKAKSQINAIEPSVSSVLFLMNLGYFIDKLIDHSNHSEEFSEYFSYDYAGRSVKNYMPKLIKLPIYTGNFDDFI